MIASSVEYDVVIVGAGQAGLECASSLRQLDYQGTVLLLGDEPHAPYSRPPLSKDYLLGEVDIDSLWLRGPNFFDSNHIELRVDTTVMSIDPEARAITLGDSTVVRYGLLVLATGGQARRLGIPEVDEAANVHYIRTIEDIAGLRENIRPAAKLTVVGGGYIGLEAAAVARRVGMEVTIVEIAPRLLSRVAGPALSAFFLELHRGEGVDVRLGASIDGYELDGSGLVSAVLLGDGNRLTTDAVVVGIGLVPDSSLAEMAGLEVANGVVVDEHCRTSDPHIFAIGDVSRHPDLRFGGTRRLESVPNASNQGRAVAAFITGSSQPVEFIPWFWSDQYDTKLQSVGMWPDHDRVIVREGAPGDRHISVFYLKGNSICAADIVGSPKDFLAAKRLIASQAVIDEEKLRNPDVEVRACGRAFVAR